MPKLARGKIGISRNAAFQYRVEQEGLRKRYAEQLAIIKLCPLEGTLWHLHVGEVALLQRAVDKRRTGKGTAGEAAADEAAGAERQPRVFAAFQREVFKENILDVLLLLARAKKQRLDVITGRKVAPNTGLLW